MIGSALSQRVNSKTVILQSFEGLNIEKLQTRALIVTQVDDGAVFNYNAKGLSSVVKLGGKLGHL